MLSTFFTYPNGSFNVEAFEEERLATYISFLLFLARLRRISCWPLPYLPGCPLRKTSIDRPHGVSEL